MSLGRRACAEAVGTAFLLAAVVGSGIMAERLSGGNVAIALLANAVATGGALVALILTFGPISGAHFNPAVSVALALHKAFAWKDVIPYVAAQLVGAVAGVFAAHTMFSLPVLQWSTQARPGLALMFAEFVATFGLLAVILVGVRLRSTTVPYAVAAYITGAYWFTASTSFANPAVTLARSMTDTFSGIHPADLAGFVLAQAVATACAAGLCGWLLPSAGAPRPRSAGE